MSSTREQQVAALPRRVAHVTYALFCAMAEPNAITPCKASEVVIFDPEARTALDTGQALRRAREAALVDGFNGVWFPTNRGHELKQALEDRYLAETTDA